jgi:dTDP-4-dehydrorhamnose reductase
MNILVTGANGQLGNELRIVSLGSADNYIFTDVNEASEEQIAMLRRLAGDGVRTDTRRLDITDLEAIRAMVAAEKVDIIINCAAFTDVEGAESRQELAERLNTNAPENLALAMKEVGGTLFHISTDYVFGAEPYNVPCREDQKGTPTGVYGLTKLHGEQKILATGCKYVIIRTAWLYSEFGKNFLKTMLRLTAEKPQLKVVFDQAGTPTYALDLAAAILKIISGRGYEAHPGIYHFSNEGVCSWYDFTKVIAQYAGHGACDIQPCHSAEFPSKVIRPAYSVLDKTLIKQTFGVAVPYWTEGVRKCVEVLG